MIIYVSPAEINGGILQFSTSIARETREIRKCKLFLPSTVDRELYEDIAEDVVAYNKVKTLQTSNEGIVAVAQKIISFSPEIVIFLEDSILMQQLNAIINKSGIQTAVITHDVQHHPYRKMGMRRFLVDVIRRKMTRKTIKQCTRMILLSNNSETAFKREYKCDNTVVFRLPAHVPNVKAEIPAELKDITAQYFLFFGRIDEYKGINRLCIAYSSLPEEVKDRNRLIIAGKGNLSEEESSLINADSCIHLINRFVDDSEMVWLFENTKVVIMPYIEASQSGVLPIAYKFGKPVVVSDLQGLTENVSMNRTGYAFKTIDQLKEILHRFDSDNLSEDEILEFCEENFSWKSNLETLFRIFQTK